MGIIIDTFSVKEELWAGPDKKRADEMCQQLKEMGIRTWSFKRNQEIPKCTGECGKCGGCNFEEGTPTYEKIGSGLSVDLLKPKGDQEIFVICVKKRDLEAAKSVI